MIDREVGLAKAIPIVEKAKKSNVSLKLMGGIAIAATAKNGSRLFPRQYKDLDFFALSSHVKAIKKILEEVGMKPNHRFNALHGADRLIFFDTELQCNVDVLLDRFRMCHVVNLKDRVILSNLTIPPSDLVLTKMQIVNITENDFRDVAALLWDFDIGKCDSETELNSEHIARVLANDWGFYKTFSINISRLLGYLGGRSESEDLLARVRALWRIVESAPKTLKWRMREKIGERVKWYEEPEEVAT